jgi:hypothetical protein
VPTKKKRTKAKRSKTAKKRVTAPKRGTKRPKLKVTHGNKEVLMASSPQNNPGADAAPSSCKIKDAGGFQINATDLPVTIQLCEDQQCDPAKSSWFQSVKAYIHDTTTPAPKQPTNITNTTFKLQPLDPNGQYDVQITVGHKPGAYCYVYESCTTSPPVLCAIDTSVEPNGSFTIEVL